MGINLASYVGATSVRRMVLGDADVQPKAEQLAGDAGARAPGDAGRSGRTIHRTAVCARALRQDRRIDRSGRRGGKYGGIYATHMRSEGNAEPDAIDEAVRIGREAHIPVEIWHLKAAGKANWGRMPQIVARIEAARASGVDVSANTYAYAAWFNTFSAFIPPWAHDGGDAKLIERLKDPATRARIRKDMLTTAAPIGTTSGRKFRARRRFIIAVVQNPELAPLQGKRLRRLQRCGTKTRSMRCAICSSGIRPSQRSPCSV